MTPLEIVCTGTPVDDHLRPSGPPCGAVFARATREVPQELALPWPPARTPVPDVEHIAAARGAGVWVSTCPACRRPSRAALDPARTNPKEHR